MSARMDKMIRRQCKHYDLPKNMNRKINKLRKQYNLDLRATLFLVDKAASMYYKNMEEITKKLEETEDGQD